MTPLKSSRLLATLLVVVGILCIFFPLLAAVGAEIFVGAALLFAAIFVLFQIPYTPSGKWWGALLFVLYLAGAWIMLANPLAGTVALATLVGVFMLIEGVFSLVLWSKMRAGKSALLLIINSIATLLIGLILLFNPAASPVLLGLLIGLNLLFTGASSLAWTRA